MNTRITIYNKAEKIYDEAAAIVLSQVEVHPFLASSKIGKANLLARQGQYALAKTLYIEAIAILEILFGKYHHELAQPKAALASVCNFCGDRDLAISLYHEAIELLQSAFGNEHPAIAFYQNNLYIANT